MRNSILVAGLSLVLVPSMALADGTQMGLGGIDSGTRASMGGGTKTSYDEGLVVEHAGVGASARIHTELRARYTFTDNDSDIGVGDTSSFDVTNARLGVDGDILEGEFEYEMLVEFANTGLDDDDGTHLLDGVLRWNACEDSSIQIGQWKTGLGRQYATRLRHLQFADRSVSSDFFDLGRQQGLGVDFDVNGVELSAAIFNGSSDGEGAGRPGVDTKHTGIVSARTDIMGDMDALVEGDIGRTDELAVNVGAAYAYATDETDGGLGGAVFDVDSSRVSADINAKSGGTSFHGEFFWADIDPDLAGAADSSPIGFYAQVGHHVTDDDEVAIRYGLLDCDDAVSAGGCERGDDVNQVTVGWNHFFWDHQMKSQLNWDFISEDLPGGDTGTSDVNTNRWLLNLVWFG